MWFFVLTGVVSALFAIWLYPHALPISGLHLHVTRDEAARIAGRFLNEANVSVPKDYHRVTTFSLDRYARTYLEMKLGLRAANRYAQNEGFCYTWVTRWFRPGNEVEYVVSVAPDGRLIQYVCHLPSDAPMPDSVRPQQVAREFVERFGGVRLDGYRLVAELKQPRAKRVDYSFTWEREGFRLGEATQRVQAVVSGDRVLSYGRWLWVPETFSHELRLQNDRGTMLSTASGVVSGVFGVVAFVVLLFAVAQRRVAWRAVLPVAFLIGAVGLAVSLNQLPLNIAEMDTDETWGAFWLRTIVFSLLGAGLTVLAVIVVVASAEYLYRKTFPDAIPLRHWLTLRGWAHPEGGKRIALGYWLLAVSFLYITAFYTVGRNVFGVWAPSTTPYDNLLSTWFPSLTALLTGIEPAVMEEFFHRVFLLCALRFIFRNTGIALFLSALVWSLAHTTYPSAPYWIRAVELMPPALFFGWLVVRFGPLPTLIAHAGYNALISSDIFLYSDSWLVRANFGLVVAVVLFPAALAWVWSKRAVMVELLAEEEQDPSASAASVSLQPPVAEEPPPREVPLLLPSARRLWQGVALLGVAVLCALGAWRLGEARERYAWNEPESLVPNARLIDRHQAIRIAKRYLPDGVNVAGWQVAAVLESDDRDVHYDYLLEFLAPPDAEQLWSRVQEPKEYWVVRWWKPGARDEWRVHLTQEGWFWARFGRIPEEAPGEKLSQQEAVQRAQRELRRLGFPVNHLRLSGNARRDLPARTEHRLTWDHNGLKVGEAQFHTVVVVTGSTVSHVYRMVTAPSSYLFERAKTTARHVIGALMTVGAGIILVLWGFRVTIEVMRRYRIPWGWGVRLSLPFLALYWVLAILNYPSWFMEQPSTVPSSWYLGYFVAANVGTSVLLAMLLASIAMSVPIWHSVLPDLPSITEWLKALVCPWRYRRIWRQAVGAQAWVWALLLLGFSVNELLATLRPVQAGRIEVPDWLVKMPTPKPTASNTVDYLLPVLVALLLAITVAAVGVVTYLGVLSSAKYMFRTVRRLVFWFLLLLLPISLFRDTWWEAAEFVLLVVALFAGGWLLHRMVLRQNPLTLAAALLHLLLISEGTLLLQYPSYRLGGIFLLLLVLVSFLWAVADWYRERRQQSSASLQPTASDYAAGLDNG